MTLGNEGLERVVERDAAVSGVAEGQIERVSRAVFRIIEAGNAWSCVACLDPVKFVAAAGLKQVIANVYDGGVWKRVEVFHPDCYEEAGEPYGTPPEYVHPRDTKLSVQVNAGVEE